MKVTRKVHIFTLMTIIWIRLAYRSFFSTPQTTYPFYTHNHTTTRNSCLNHTFIILIIPFVPSNPFRSIALRLSTPSFIDCNSDILPVLHTLMPNNSWFLLAPFFSYFIWNFRSIKYCLHLIHLVNPCLYRSHPSTCSTHISQSQSFSVYIGTIVKLIP